MVPFRLSSFPPRPPLFSKSVREGGVWGVLLWGGGGAATGRSLQVLRQVPLLQLAVVVQLRAVIGRRHQRHGAVVVVHVERLLLHVHGRPADQSQVAKRQDTIYTFAVLFGSVLFGSVLFGFGFVLGFYTNHVQNWKLLYVAGRSKSTVVLFLNQ